MKGYTESDLIARFDETGNSKRRWVRQAKDLLSSSSALLKLWEGAIEHDPPEPVAALNYLDPGIMLRAMAIECLLKAWALDRGVKLAKSGRYVGIDGLKQDHNLVSLAKQVDFKMNSKEEAVLRHLSRMITAGRYPIQRHWKEQMRLTPDGKLRLLTVGWHPWGDGTCSRIEKRLLDIQLDPHVVPLAVRKALAKKGVKPLP